MKPVLNDHKREGGVFVPPILNLGTFLDTPWLDYAVPEFVWVLLFIEKFGIEDGNELYLNLVSLADPYFKDKIKNGSAACMISFYLNLDDSEKQKLLQELKSAGILSRIRVVLNPFIKLYPECPLKFLSNQKNQDFSKRYLNIFKVTLIKMLDKMGYDATLVMASVLNFLCAHNRFFITESTNMPPLEEILDYPGTDNSKKVASFLRSIIPIFFLSSEENTYDRNNQWIIYFWNQNIKIEPCKI
jgi:hypothetical protein